jgi:hypothetical protein
MKYGRHQAETKTKQATGKATQAGIARRLGTSTGHLKSMCATDLHMDTRPSDRTTKRHIYVCSTLNSKDDALPAGDGISARRPPMDAQGTQR